MKLMKSEWSIEKETCAQILNSKKSYGALPKRLWHNRLMRESCATEFWRNRSDERELYDGTSVQ